MVICEVVSDLLQLSWGGAGVGFVLHRVLRRFPCAQPRPQPWPRRSAPRRASSTCRASSTRRRGSSSTSGPTSPSSRPCSSSPSTASAWGRLSTGKPSTTTPLSSSIWRSVHESSGFISKPGFFPPFLIFGIVVFSLHRAVWNTERSTAVFSTKLQMLGNLVYCG